MHVAVHSRSLRGAWRCVVGFCWAEFACRLALALSSRCMAVCLHVAVHSRSLRGAWRCVVSDGGSAQTARVSGCNRMSFAFAAAACSWFCSLPWTGSYRRPPTCRSCDRMSFAFAASACSWFCALPWTGWSARVKGMVWGFISRPPARRNFALSPWKPTPAWGENGAWPI